MTGISCFRMWLMLPFKNLLDEHWTSYLYKCIDSCVFVIRIHRLCLFPVINNSKQNLFSVQYLMRETIPRHK